MSKKSNIVIDKLTGKKLQITWESFKFNKNKYVPQKCGKVIHCYFKDRGTKPFIDKPTDKMFTRSINQLKRY